METKELLYREIVTEFKNLDDMEQGTDEYKAAVDGITKLLDRSIEIEKIEADVKLKTEQMAENKKDRILHYSISIGGIVIPTAVTIWGTLKSLKFEEVGTITTNAGRSFMNRLFRR